jgi:hypothetical protein
MTTHRTDGGDRATARLDETLAALLRGERVGGHALAAFDPVAVCERAEYHGVLPLIAERTTALAAPASLRDHLQSRSTRAVAADVVRESLLRDTLAALHEAGIPFLVLKGTHLAYACYERPDHRPRLDTDILVRAADRPAVHDVLDRLGYRMPGHVDGDLLLAQATYVKKHGDEMAHIVDVHWRLANPQAFASLPSFDALMADAVPVPALGPAVRGLDGPAALLFACVHRVAHHFDTPRLIWLYDIHLLSSRLSPPAWDRFVASAVSSGVTTICRQSLMQARQRLQAVIPESVLQDPRLSTPDRTERTAEYLVQRTRAQQVLGELRALPRWRDRLQLVRQHLFPSAAYMREVYAGSSRAPLPYLYATRVMRGARRWLAHVPARDDGFHAP